VDAVPVAGRAPIPEAVHARPRDLISGRAARVELPAEQLPTELRRFAGSFPIISKCTTGLPMISPPLCTCGSAPCRVSQVAPEATNDEATYVSLKVRDPDGCVTET